MLRCAAQLLRVTSAGSSAARAAAAGQQLCSLAPPGDPDLEPPPSDCPVFLCKTRAAINAACWAFEPNRTADVLPVSLCQFWRHSLLPSAQPPEHSLLPRLTPQGLPTARLHASNGADAVVAWKESELTGIIIWQ